MTSQDIIVATLNDLIETCRDGEYGFNECAKHTSSTELKSIFTQCAHDCRSAAHDLEEQVLVYGARPAQGGTASGALHRGWVAVRGSLFGLSDRVLLEECERGEDAAVARYRAAVQDDKLPESVRQLVQQQLRGVQQNHDQIVVLRDRLKATA